MKRLTLLGLVAVSACGGGPGVGPDDVVVTIIDHRVTDTEVIDEPASDEPQLVAWTSAGEEHRARKVGDGRWAISGIASDDVFTLRAGATRPYTFLVTRARQISLGTTRTGRAVVARADAYATLGVQVDGLATWDAADELRLGCFGTRTDTSLALPPPPTGATTIDAAAAWSSGPRIDAHAGDVVTLLQKRSVSFAGLAALTTVVSGAIAEPLTVASAGETPLHATFDGAQTIVDLDWRVPAFDAEVPSASAPESFLEVQARPTAAIDEPFEVGDHLSLARATGDHVDAIGALRFADPFPVAWQRAVVATTRFDATGPGYPRSNLVEVTTVVALDTALAIVPLVNAPTSLRIDGEDASAITGGHGVTPALSWDGQAAATAYIVRVYRLATGFPTPEHALVATIVTNATSIAVPFDVLLPDAGSYTFEVTAVHAPGVDLTATPYAQALPFGTATNASAAFTP